MGTISLSKTIQYVKTIDVEIMDIDVKTNISEQGSEVRSIEKKILGTKYDPEVVMEDKVYPETYYKHKLRSL